MSGQRHLEGDLVTARRGFFWVGGERVPVRQGTAIRGQMYVQWEAPENVTKPYPIVMIHGGGGQGTDWLGTPDGRAGWATFLLQEGYAVYVVDRPGHGRAPFHPDVLGPPGGVFTVELVSALFTDAANGPMAHPTAHLHTEWPGRAMRMTRSSASSPPEQGRCSRMPGSRTPWSRHCGAALLDEIGPAILMTASAGGPMGWLTADARPSRVKAIVAVEPIGPAFLVNPNLDLSLDWGLTAAPMTFDPPAASPAELLKETTETPAGPCTLQAEPARRLQNLEEIPIALVEAEASLFAHAGPATAAFLEQAGCHVERIALAEHGVRGNGHLMMLERNNRQALGPILRWLDDTVR